MLYKVTPSLDAQPKAAETAEKPARQPRKRRKTALFDSDGHEVLITLMCLKCRTMKPLAQFGLRKMADGAIRNQPWCRGCRSQAGTRPRKTEQDSVQAAPAPSPEATAFAGTGSSTAQLPESQDAVVTAPGEAYVPASEALPSTEP
ncbi:MAG: hypothetical protein RL653_4268 [Pseudomonadota bacterium]|jgi:hypothetical protein